MHINLLSSQSAGLSTVNNYLKEFVIKQKCVPWFILNRVQPLYAWLTVHLQIKKIDLEKTYVGGFDKDNINDYIKKSGDSKRAHLLLKNSPYVNFLEEFRDHKEFEGQEFFNSEYYRMAAQCMKVYGHFFGIRNPLQLIIKGRSFLRLYQAVRDNKLTKREFKMIAEEVPCIYEQFPNVTRISDSEDFIVNDGHHRLSIQYMLGKKITKARIVGAINLEY